MLHTARPLSPEYGLVPGTRRQVLETVLDTVASLVPEAGGRAALQGAETAADAWLGAAGDVDLDVWADQRGYEVLAGQMRRLWGARVQHADDPDRLRHTAWVVETVEGPALVDVTWGDLAVGPITMVDETDVIVRSTALPDGTQTLRLDGVAAAADLLVRPLLRGKVPASERLAEARAAWMAAAPLARHEFDGRLSDQLGTAVAADIIAVLDGAEPDAALLSSIRRAYSLASLRQLRAAWHQRGVIIPAGRRAGIAGVRAKGVLVVLVGTDGSGKSTVAGKVADRLDRLGIPTSHAYMGMARGNLPGVGLARKLLRIPAPEQLAKEQLEKEAASPAEAAPPEDPRPGGGELDHAMLRKAAAWFYAGEYLFRYARDIRPRLRVKGTPAVVIADRYVYDLQDSPWPGSPAARVARRLMPRPDVLLVPDAPDDVIHARKPERAAHEQAAQQASFRALAAEGPARHASLLVDTSGTTEPPVDPITPAIASIVEAMHVKP